MKRFTILLISFILAWGFVSCNKSNDKNKNLKLLLGYELLFGNKVSDTSGMVIPIPAGVAQ